MHHNRGPRPPHRIQSFESNGPNVKIRGNAYQVFERYIAMAREAASAGDRVAAENLYQHAEHYYRIMQANGEGYNQQNPRPMTPADNEAAQPEEGDGQPGAQAQGQHQPNNSHGQQPAQPQSAPPAAPTATPGNEPQPPTPAADQDYNA